MEKQKQDELDRIEGTERRRISSEEYFSSKNDIVQQTKHDIIEAASSSSPPEGQSKPTQSQQGQPLVIIEQTPEGQKKHVFYGDVKMLGQDGQVKAIAGSDGATEKIDQEIQKEQEAIEQFIRAKKERLKQLQKEKLQTTQAKIEDIDAYAQEDLRSKK